jgi:hypothetical protein
LKKLFQLIAKFLKGRHEKKIVWIFIATGSTLILVNIPQQYWYYPVIDAIFKTKFTNSVNEVNYLLLFITLPIGLLLMGTGLWFHFKTRQKAKKLHMLQIRHTSIESVGFSKISDEMDDYNVEILPLNQLEELKTFSKENLEHALREQEKFVQRISNSLDGSSDKEVAYFGLAHIPLMILLGFQIADKSSVKFFEWNQGKLRWDEIGSNNNVFPSLIEEEELLQSPEETKEVVVKIGLTFPIPNSDLTGLNLDGLNSFYLHLDPPHRNAIIGVEQLDTYKEEFRRLLDKILQKYPNLQRVHLFYSGQPSFAYRLGSALTERMDKEIIAYNYVGSSNPKYNWAINLKKPGKQISILVTGDN